MKIQILWDVTVIGCVVPHISECCSALIFMVRQYKFAFIVACLTQQMKTQ